MSNIVDEKREEMLQMIMLGMPGAPRQIRNSLNVALIAFQRFAESNALLQASKDHLTQHEILARSIDLSTDGMNVCMKHLDGQR